MYLLCKSNTERCYSSVQVWVGGIAKIIREVYSIKEKQYRRTPFVVSTWYAEEIGFVREPYL